MDIQERDAKESTNRKTGGQHARADAAPARLSTIVTRPRNQVVAMMIAASIAAVPAAAFADEPADATTAGGAEQAVQVDAVDQGAQVSNGQQDAVTVQGDESTEPQKAADQADGDAASGLPATEGPAADADGAGTGTDAGGQETGAPQAGAASGEGTDTDGEDGTDPDGDVDVPGQDAAVAATASQAQVQANAKTLGAVRKAPATTQDVASIGETGYSSLAEAIQKAQSGDTIKVLADNSATSAIEIAADKVLTLIGNGTAKVTLNGNGQFLVKGGSLTLGDGTTENALTIVNDTNNKTAIVVSSGGTLTVKDGFTLENNDKSEYAISVGNENVSGTKSIYHGEGGTITGGTVYIAKNGDGYIKGGTYTSTTQTNPNYGGNALNVYGHLSEISGGTFTGTGYRTIDVVGGTIDKIVGTDSSPVTITNTGTSKTRHDGIFIRRAGYIGTIGGNVTVDSGQANGYESGSGAVWLYTEQGQGKAGIGSITGGTFRGTNYGLVLLGGSYSEENMAVIDSISGGYFYGKTNGINVNRFAKVGSISNAEFYGVEPTYRNDEDRETQWGGAGMYNFGEIGSISNAKFEGGTGGITNSKTIGSIKNVTITGKNADSEGVYNGNYYDYYNYYINKRSDLFPNAEDAWFKGAIGLIEDSTVTGGLYGIVNTGTITKISGAKVITTNGQVVYQEKDDQGNVTATGYTTGIYNAIATVVTKVEKNSSDNRWVVSEDGTTQVPGSIGTIKDTKVNLDAESSYGMRNKGTVTLVENSAFKGSSAGIVNEENATLSTIGDGNVVYGYGEDGYGYWNKSSVKTEIEPGLKGSGKDIGTGRYWGAKGSIVVGANDENVKDVWAQSDSEYADYPAYGGTGADASTYYHLSHSTDSTIDKAILLDDVTEFPNQGFRYLKKYLELSYDKNADAATGTVGSQSETTEDGQRLNVAANGYARAGWKFAGWNTKADGTGTAFNPYAAGGSGADAITDAGTLSAGDTANMKAILTAGNATLYAQWVPYTISYDANASGSTGATAGSSSSESDGAVTVAANGFARDGYTFAGWNTKADGTGVAYTAEEALTLDGDMVLYAQWEPAPAPEPAKGQRAVAAKAAAAPAAPAAAAESVVPQTGDAADAAFPAGAAIASGLVAALAAALGLRRNRGRHAR